jgi:hypothetical protein
LSGVRATIVAVEKQWVLHKLNVCFNLNYQAWNALAPYCHLWPIRLYNMFPHYLINEMIFEIQLPKLERVFWFSLHIPHSKKNWARYDEKYILVIMWSARYSCPISRKFKFLDTFSKRTQISFCMKISPVVDGLLMRTDGRKDRWT